MSNKKITQLPINGNPTFSDVFPIVNDGITKQLSLTGLTAFIEPYINAVTPPFTGGTVSGATIFTNGLTANTISATTYLGLPSTSGLYLPLSGGTVSGPTRFNNGLRTNTISATTYQNLPIDITVTGGTYSSSAETVTFTNNTGGTFNVTGIPNGNTKKWKTGGTVEISGEETILVSGNYVLQDSELNILDGGDSISIGNILFEEKGELYIGGNTFFNDTTINNDGIISISGALILSGNTTITGTGIII